MKQTLREAIEERLGVMEVEELKEMLAEDSIVTGDGTPGSEYDAVQVGDRWLLPYPGRGGQTLENVHPPGRCEGRPCCIHNPSDHPLRRWPMHFRDDNGLMERICPCGIGHPDPDDPKAGGYAHGCCSCHGLAIMGWLTDRRERRGQPSVAAEESVVTRRKRLRDAPLGCEGCADGLELVTRGQAGGPPGPWGHFYARRVDGSPTNFATCPRWRSALIEKHAPYVVHPDRRREAAAPRKDPLAPYLPGARVYHDPDPKTDPELLKAIERRARRIEEMRLQREAEGPCSACAHPEDWWPEGECGPKAGMVARGYHRERGPSNLAMTVLCGHYAVVDKEELRAEYMRALEDVRRLRVRGRPLDRAVLNLLDELEARR